VATEVRRGLVSEAAAASEYGVVVRDGAVDEAATEQRREETRQTRPDLAEFDYGPLPDTDELEAQIAAERRKFDSRGN
jgi:N-methylhydantoinase B